MLNHHVVPHPWSTRRRNFSPLVCLSFLLALMVALIPSSSPNQAALRAQPALIALAQQQPEQEISVIIQKQGEARVEQLVEQLGGVVTLDLHIINAFAARMPARTALTLAGSNGVHWVSLDAPVVKPSAICLVCITTTNLRNVYDSAIGADKLWNEAPQYLQGQGVGVAIVDSGMNPGADFYTNAGMDRIVAAKQFNNGYNQNPYDRYGHGQHVAGIIGGNGRQMNGLYIGVAPMVNLINVKVSDDNGAATAANVVAGLQWVNDNRDRYNIKVVNISLNSSVDESYHTNPIDAAVEILWFNKVVVVVSAGNIGRNALFPPANDPFVITVGATDDRGTAATTDDVVASFSGHGVTTDGFNKPDLVAPGTNIISLSASSNSILALAHLDHLVNGGYFRMSGTSMSAPMVAGAAALLLQDEPNLTPDQLKYRLMATARPLASQTGAGAGLLDIYAAVRSATTQSANTNTQASRLLFSGSNAVNWNSVNWNSVNWNSVNWNSVNWNSVNWNSVNWNSDIWN